MAPHFIRWQRTLLVRTYLYQLSLALQRKALTSLRDRKGDKLCEIKLGITENLEACDFYAKDVWFRGIADLVILDDDLAWVVDYKTGKSAKYADKGQLELMALGVFAKYPQIKTVRAGLLFCCM